jgi:hypothetical protein
MQQHRSVSGVAGSKRCTGVQSLHRHEIREGSLALGDSLGNAFHVPSVIRQLRGNLDCFRVPTTLRRCDLGPSPTSRFPMNPPRRPVHLPRHRAA